MYRGNNKGHDTMEYIQNTKRKSQGFYSLQNYL